MSPFDPTVVERLFDDIGRDEAAMRELIGVFREQTPALLRAAQDASERKDARALLRAAHTLKSTAMTFGAKRLHELARSLEADAASGIPADALARTREMAREWDVVSGAIGAWRPSPSRHAEGSSRPSRSP